MGGRRGPLRADAEAIWRAGVEAVDPARLVRAAMRVRGGALHIGGALVPLGPVRRIAVVGAGKAGAAMAEATERVLGPRWLEAKDVVGWVNVPAPAVHPLERVILHPARPAGVNRPTSAGVVGTERILDLLRTLGPRDLVLCLISGGGSALLPAPAGEVTLEDLQELTGLLHGCGASIVEMNAVRKHLSRVKGGGLARAAGKARVVSLIVSDVVGDPVDAIASGPTAADPTTYGVALGVLEKYGLVRRAPRRAVEHLRRGAAGELPETVKRLGGRVANMVIGNNRTALAAAARRARGLGYRVVDLGSRIEGESREVGVVLAGLAEAARDEARPAAAPVCLLSGGETTVSLGDRPGRGGRNQELVLAALAHLGLEGLRDVAVLSGGTDGEDGPTDAAGAVVDSALARRAARLGLDARRALERHDAYPFFEAASGLLKTGPTGTNVMDLRVVLVGRSG